MTRRHTIAVLATLALLGVPNWAGAATPATLVLWDGATHRVGVGWVSPTGPDMAVVVPDRHASEKPRPIAFHLAHPNTFVECGWQWANWYPAFAGTDITAYDTLVLTVQIHGVHIPGDVMLSLASPGDHNNTGRVRLERYAPNWSDGAWHTLCIPLADLFHADRTDLEARFPGSKFDAKHTTQVIFGAWNAEGDFTVSLAALTLVAAKKSPSP